MGFAFRMLIGIVGKTNVGKSTFFKALTLAEVEISARPFTTIKPNHGIAYVRVSCPCKEFGVRCNPKNSFCIDGNRFAPVEVLDVAGLVPGAHEGRGLGNKFLDDLRQADCFIHIIDISGTTDENGRETKGYDPSKDIRFIEEEIDLWLYSILKRNWAKLTRVVSIKGEEFEKSLANQLSGLGIKFEHVVKARKESGLMDKNPLFWNDEELLKFASNLRRISKPMIIAANKVDLPSAEDNLRKVKEEFKGYEIVPCCAEAELALRQAARRGIVKYIPGDGDFEILKASPEQKKALDFIRERVLKKFGSTGVQETINKAVLEILGCVVVFPVEDENKLTDKDGNVLPDALVMPKGSTALDLALKVHTELGEKFIKAIECRSKKFVGRDYTLKNLDVIKIFT